MSVQRIFMVALAVLVTASFFSGCKKKTTTMPQPTIQKPVADTDFKDAAPMRSIDTSDNVSFRGVDLDAEFQRLVQENLQTVYFDYNRFNLSDETTRKLRIAADFLTAHPTARVLIEGHCDERGAAEYNMGLGENRARSVREYLANYGIPRLRMEITSWGKERLARGGCFDDACHQVNRRAEFKVLSK
jgi:peptidoglycan-associated lipoprotein